VGTPAAERVAPLSAGDATLLGSGLRVLGPRPIAPHTARARILRGAPQANAHLLLGAQGVLGLPQDEFRAVSFVFEMDVDGQPRRRWHERDAIRKFPRQGWTSGRSLRVPVLRLLQRRTFNLRPEPQAIR